MEVATLRLRNFRNYAAQEVEFCSGVNVISGANALGKTSLLEAIFLCTCARSHRTAKDRELIRHENNDYQVEISFTDQNNKGSLQGKEIFWEHLEISYLEAQSALSDRKKNQRIVRYNGMKLDRIVELMGLFHAVIFAPEDTMMIKEGPQSRRRFLDLLISQMNAHYFSSLQLYGSILTQRNKLLKLMKDMASDARGNTHLQMQADIWTEQLAAAGAEILYLRFTYTDRLSELARGFHKEISSSHEDMQLRYETVRGISGDKDKEEIKKIFLEKLKKQEEEDRLRGSTSSGPHRDDLDITINGKSMKAFGSQGQQRTAVLALKLAELRLIQEKTGKTPVLLLDDVLSELDESRRISLIRNITDAQVFITCTDVEEVHDKLRELLLTKESKLFRVVQDSSDEPHILVEEKAVNPSS